MYISMHFLIPIITIQLGLVSTSNTTNGYHNNHNFAETSDQSVKSREELQMAAGAASRGNFRSGQYRISNLWQGLCRSLDTSGRMVKTAHSSDQYWWVADHPSQKNLVKFINSAGQSLKLRRGYYPFVSTESGASEEWFKLDPSRSNPKYHRLVSWADTGKVVSVDSMSGARLTSVNNADLFGNYWNIDPVEKVTGVPSGFDAYYRKYINMNGIPIVSSSAVPDSVLYQAYFIVRHLLSASPQALSRMVRNKAKLAVIGVRERTTQIPEHRFLDSSHWDTRARGLGGSLSVPTASCAEENLMCFSSDKWRKEDITIHEFSHSIQLLGLNQAISGFESNVKRLYDSAVRAGKYRNTYAGSNPVEYFAEGVQNWLEVNEYANPPNGIHNHVYDRATLKSYDPELHKLLAQHFPADTNKCSCH